MSSPSETMLAAVYHGPDDLRLEQVPIPQIGSNEVLLKVISAGICGTDLRILHGGHRHYPPGTVRIPGHEVVGDIVRVGDDVRGLDVGQRVLVAPNMGCGHCRQCIRGNNNLCADFDAIGITRDGAFAQYVRIPAAAVLQGNLIPIAPDTDPAAAALIEPFACVLRGQRALRIQPIDLVLIVGAGPIGILHTMLARLHGARRVVVSGRHADRRAKARAAGADRIVDPENEDLAAVIDAESDGAGADVVIVAAAAPRAQEESLDLAAIGGRINFFGGLPKDRPTIEANANTIHYKELIVTGTTACSTQDCRDAAALVNSGRIDLSSVISERFPLSAARDAFAAAADRRSLKVVLQAEA